MLNITATLVDFFSQYPQPTIIVAYSGGVDSQVLLHALTQLKNQKKINNPLLACHVNHGLSEHAMAWQTFTKLQCQQLDVTFKSFQVHVKAQAQHSLEQLARDARYQALQSLCSDLAKPCLVVTGHHSDDQSETFLLALKRGAGVKGLSAMATTCSFGEPSANHQLVRPLLTITRADIIHYAQQHNLSWIEDDSNQDSRFDRNFLRHHIMPLLKERWPSINTAIARSAQHCQSAQALLDELAQQDLAQCAVTTELSHNSTRVLNVAPLIKLSINRFNNVLRYFLTLNHCLMPSTEQLAQVYKQLTAMQDKMPAVKVGQYWLRRYGEQLFLTDDFADVSTWQANVALDESTADTQGSIMKLPDNLGTLVFNSQQAAAVVGNDNDNVNYSIQLKSPKNNSQISITFSHTNPRCLPDFRQHSRPLKKILQELKIAPWQRKRIPLLYYDDVLVAAIGYFVCQDFIMKNNGVSGKVSNNVTVPSIELTWHKSTED